VSTDIVTISSIFTIFVSPHTQNISQAANSVKEQKRSRVSRSLSSGSMRTEVSKLLFCACRDHCIKKTTPQSTTHKCPGCSIPIHPECGFPDEEDANIRWCHQCKIGRTPSPTERLTRRKIREKNLSLPKNLFDDDETITLDETLTLDDTITQDERSEMSKNDTTKTSTGLLVEVTTTQQQEDFEQKPPSATNNFAQDDAINDETSNTSGSISYSQQKKPPPKTSENVVVVQMNRSTSMFE
jgi:hypothetical protein